MQTLLNDLPTLKTPELPKTLRPVQGRGRDVILSWLSVGLLIVVILFLKNQQSGSICLMESGLALFSILAISLTYSYWNDKQTSITLDMQGISYTSPFRKVYLQWTDVQVMAIYSAGKCTRIAVRSEKKFFTFRMPFHMPSPSDLKSIIGFPDGHIITTTIIKLACLDQTVSLTDDSIRLSRVSDEQNSNGLIQPE